MYTFMLSGEQQYQFYSLWFDPTNISSNPSSTTFEVSTITITTLMWLRIIERLQWSIYFVYASLYMY